jgi:hypothetical protein
VDEKASRRGWGDAEWPDLGLGIAVGVPLRTLPHKTRLGGDDGDGGEQGGGDTVEDSVELEFA